MNFLTKHSKAIYYIYGILIAVMIFAGLFYASQYCDVRVLYSLSGDSVEILPGTADNLNRSNRYVFEYFAAGNLSSLGFSSNFDDYSHIVYDFQILLSHVNDLIIILGLVSLICFAGLLVLSNHSRRIYYKSNLVGGAILPLIVAILTIILLVNNLSVMGVFNENYDLFNFVSLLQGDNQIYNSQMASSELINNFTCNSTTFALFMILFIIVIAYSIFLIAYACIKYKATAEERAEILKKAVGNND